MEAGLAGAPGPIRAQATRLIDLGMARVAAREGEGGPLTVREQVVHRVLDATLGARLRRQLGLDRGRIFVSSAAPVDPDLLSRGWRCSS